MINNAVVDNFETIKRRKITKTTNENHKNELFKME